MYFTMLIYFAMIYFFWKPNENFKSWNESAQLIFHGYTRFMQNGRQVRYSWILVSFKNEFPGVKEL